MLAPLLRGLSCVHLSAQAGQPRGDAAPGLLLSPALGPGKGRHSPPPPPPLHPPPHHHRHHHHRHRRPSVSAVWLSVTSVTRELALQSSVWGKCRSAEPSRDLLRPSSVRAASLCRLELSPGRHAAHVGGGLVSLPCTAVPGRGGRPAPGRHPLLEGVLCADAVTCVARLLLQKCFWRWPEGDTRAGENSVSPESWSPPGSPGAGGGGQAAASSSEQVGGVGAPRLPPQPRPRGHVSDTLHLRTALRPETSRRELSPSPCKRAATQGTGQVSPAGAGASTHAPPSPFHSPPVGDVAARCAPTDGGGGGRVEHGRQAAVLGHFPGTASMTLSLPRDRNPPWGWCPERPRRRVGTCGRQRPRRRRATARGGQRLFNHELPLHRGHSCDSTWHLRRARSIQERLSSLD